MITDFAMFGAISFETSAVASIFVYRRRYPVEVALPYRCPLYPVLPAVYVCRPRGGAREHVPDATG